ncbi:MAG TPA: tetratricopeptide repeat protein [Allosphingosinicella sp.]|jgi:cytochrome c-type biogenesis protein CcmH/NrfG|nr:tetratricopeptide repeat protein [Allosphingosinicella sp.]
MGWLALLALAAAAFAGVWRFARLDRATAQLLAAALLLACAGYAWQGSPGRPGAPRTAAERPPLPETAFATLRKDMFGQFDSADRWLTMSERYLARGDTRQGAGLIRSAIRAHPDNAILWTGYGDALVLHGNGLLSPAADLAFRRAVSLAPKHPGPRIFRGIALAQNGRFEEAELSWRQALALSPADSPWREGLERQIEMVRQARAQQR